MLKYCIYDNLTIKDAISVINKSEMRCAKFFNEFQKIVGVFSEGDVIRSLLQGTDIHTPLKSVICPTFFYLKEKNILKAYHLIKKEGITLIPIIDDDFNLLDVITLFDVMEHLHYEKKT